MNKITAITGPTGSGKTTVSLALAKKLDKCVFIEVDHIKHMILSGFYKEVNENNIEKWHYSEWRLLGETIGVICNNFIDKNFNVVIGGYLHIEAWEELEKQVNIDYKFLLHPSKETIKVRDVERDSKYYMGEDAIQEHIDYIESNELFNDFTAIDSSEQTVDETVAVILDSINNHS
jgi:gluconate kinase